MKKALTMSVQGGHFRTGRALGQASEDALRAAVAAGGTSLVQTLAAHTPEVSGTLKRSWVLGSPRWDGAQFAAAIGNRAPYARRVNRTSKRHAGYIERGFAAGSPEARRLLERGALRLRADLWEPGK